MADCCENAMALWREIRHQGFAGPHRKVHRHVAERRAVPAQRTAQKGLSRTGSTGAEVLRPEPIASLRQPAWILVQPIKTLPHQAVADLSRIRQDAEAARVADLARRFTMLVRACGLDDDQQADAAGELDRWLFKTRTCGVAAGDLRGWLGA